jgi:hypothetical protein
MISLRLDADPDAELIGIPDLTADKQPMQDIAYNAALDTFESLAQAAPARPAGGRGGSQARGARRDRAELAEEADLPGAGDHGLGFAILFAA